MSKIDRLGWAAGFAFESYGVRVGVRTNDPAALKHLSAHLPPGWKPARAGRVERLYSIFAPSDTARARGVRRFNLLYGDAGRLARTQDLSEALEAFESDLQLYVAASARRRLFVHAGVVSWRGRAILLPGRSFAGKSTLVAALVGAGATYYSDEYAVLDRAGRVHPFARPIGLRGGATGRRKKVHVESLEGASGARPLPVGLVVLSEYREGARFRPRRLTEGQGLLALLSNTVSARRRPEEALCVLQRVASGAASYKAARGEAQGAATSILNLLDASTHA
ncbi:MAG TPA: hypothetical protein VLJ61_19090 [Pyrinomonadaceae bacterium]|nr:hypothetical protein [Pyrinomonadaceae bacterium]